MIQGSKLAALVVYMLSCVVGQRALPHSGGTDANGCHTDRQTGNFHCHGSGSSDDRALTMGAVGGFGAFFLAGGIAASWFAADQSSPGLAGAALILPIVGSVLVFPGAYNASKEYGSDPSTVNWVFGVGFSALVLWDVLMVTGIVFSEDETSDVSVQLRPTIDGFATDVRIRF